MNTYPTSLFERNAHLERENAKLRNALSELCTERDRYTDRLRADLIALQELTSTGSMSRLWIWQGDGYDYTRSMSSTLPVLITGQQLRDLIQYGEKIAED